MPLTKAVITQPIFEQSKTYAAQDDRRAYADYASAGVVGVNDFLVTAAGGLGVSVAAGAAWALGGSVADQGAYRVYHGSATGLTCAANSAQNRIDQIILRIMDSTHDTTGLQEANLAIAPGTPISGVTLAAPGASPMDLTVAANLDGAKAYILLAYVLVPGGSGAVTVLDKRARALLGAGAMKGSTTGIGNTLPGSPGDGDEYYYVFDTAYGKYWHLKWKSSISKWVVIGGLPLESYVDYGASGDVAANVYNDMPTPVQITIPLAGEYIFEWAVRQAQHITGSFANRVWITPKYGAAAIVDTEGIKMSFATSLPTTSGVGHSSIKTMAFNDVVKLQWKHDGSNTANHGIAAHGTILRAYPRRF